MWPWIKRWRDWAMHDLWPLLRPSPAAPQALHYSFEKAGLTLENQPIPWNAEAVVVEAAVRLPPAASRNKSDFTLRLAAAAGGADGVIVAETLRQDEADAPARLFFRLPVPPASTSAEVFWRQRSLGRVDLPVLSADAFLQQLSLQHPTVSAVLGGQIVVCQTFVNTQCQGLLASALLTSPTSLAPVVDLGLRVELHREDGEPLASAPVPLTSGQLRSRQTLASASLPKPRRIGPCVVRWVAGDRVLATQRVRGISRKQFLQSLRISATRFVMQNEKGEFSVVRTLPCQDGAPTLQGAVRAGPCFLVTSGESGMAGLATLQVRAQVAGALQPPLMQEQKVLVTDGPMPFAPGTLDAADLGQVQHFTLESALGRLGLLPLAPAPAAHFNSEGGFVPADDFTWSPAAEEQYNERLSKLLGGS
jgi:hypothetical protein